MMTFGDLLNQYLSQYQVSAKKLAALSNLSPSALSRARNTLEKVSLSEEQLVALSEGIAQISGGEITAEEALEAFRGADNYRGNTVKIKSENLNMLIEALNLNASELAKSLNFDASYLSRIRNGARNPSDTAAFAHGVAQFAVKRCEDEAKCAILCDLVGCTEAELPSALEVWLCEGELKRDTSVESFLSNLNSFHLGAYIESIRFNDIRVPTVPFHLPTSKTYYGLKEMRKGELDFFRTAILSKSKEDVFMYSEMPMSDMAEDVDFSKKWMMSIAFLLKKGVHLHIIHNLDRPWQEIMLGLEAWVPIYMTGLVSPYYIKNPHKGVFRHVHCTAGTVALSGDGIEGKHNESRYYLTKNKDEVAYFRSRSKALLAKASPLMEIYTAEQEAQFNAFLASQEDYTVQENAAAVFKNITIRVCNGKWASVSKTDDPHIHFLIFHPRLVSGIENFEPPVKET